MRSPARTLLATLALAASLHAQEHPRTPVLVELFTSEGCSSCPPADALLARLQREQPIPGAEIIVLGEHVDYWDQLGWRDRFSNPLFTARQSAYSQRFHLDGPYTPQMVVDGAAEMVGNNQPAVWQAITEAARASKPLLLLSPLLRDGHHLSSTVSAANLSALGPADLYAALISPLETTQVRRGENGGHTLQHVAVVQTLTRIGGTTELARGPLPFTLTAPDAADPANLGVVVFAQQSNLGPITAVASAHPNFPNPSSNLTRLQSP